MRAFPAVAFVLLACGSAIGQTSTAQADLDILGLTVGPTPSWTDGQPGSTRIDLRVVNHGATASAYRIDYTWVPEGGAAMALNGDVHTSFDVGEPLGQGPGRLHHATWTLAPGQAGPGRVVATVTAVYVDANAENDAEATADPLFIAVREVSLGDLANETLQVPPEATRFLRVPVRNDGNQAVDVAMAVQGMEPPEGRLVVAFEPPVLRVPANRTANATLFVRFEPAGDLAPFLTRLNVTAHPGYGKPLNTTTGTVRDAPADGTQGYAFDLGPSGLATVHVPYPGQATQLLRVRNLGSRADDYTLRAAIPSGWQASFDPARIALAPGAAGDVTLRLRAAASDLEGAPALVSVEAESGSSGQRRQLDLPARRGGSGVRVAGVALDDVYVGDTPQAVVTLANEGDAPSPDSTLRVEADIPGRGRVVLPLAPAPPAPAPGLGPGEQAQVRVALPPMTHGGPLAVQATWLPKPGLHAPEPASYAGLVHAPAVTLKAPLGVTGVPGETVRYVLPPSTFTLTNMGNSVETFLLRTSGVDGAGRIDGPVEVTLAPGDKRSIAVVHELPLPANSTIANLTVEAVLVARAQVWRAVVHTQIEDRSAPRVALAAAPAASAGVPVRLRVEVADDGRIVAVALNATSSSGAVARIDARRDADGWVADWVPEASGPHVVRAVARDLAGNEGGARVDVPVAEAPAPVVRAPAAKQVRPGTVLVFEVGEGPALSSVEARLAQGGTLRSLNATMEPGKVLVTMPASEGPGTLTVLARNRFGAATTLAVEVEVTKAAPAGDAGTPDGPSRDADALALGLAVLALAAAGVRRRLP